MHMRVNESRQQVGALRVHDGFRRVVGDLSDAGDDAAREKNVGVRDGVRQNIDEVCVSNNHANILAQDVRFGQVSSVGLSCGRVVCYNGGMKRLVLFLVTNLAAVVMLTVVASVVCALLGVNVSEFAEGGGGYLPLLMFAFIFGMTGSVISLLLSKTMVRLTMRCKTIDGTEGEAERWLVVTVEDLARRANIKTPEVAIYPGEANAFATGAFKNSALVAVSTGIMGQMTKEELRAVLGHEISHIANGDMVTMSLTQGVINTFVIFFSHVLASVVQGAMNGERDNRRRGGGHFMYYMIVQLFQLLFGLLASLVIFWYSRTREYAADAGSAQLLGSPAPMIAALRRLGNLQPGVLPDSLKAFGIAGGKTSLFATHPSLDDRIDALMNIPPSYAV